MPPPQGVLCMVAWSYFGECVCVIEETPLCLSRVGPSGGGGIVLYMWKWGILIEITNGAND
jgi:hypothetical protein